MAQPVDSLPRLRADVVSCRACPRLVAWREAAARQAPARFAGQRYWARPVPGFGDPEARLVIVGLAPAAHGANRTGRMFTGDRSGDFLYAALHRAGYANQATSASADDGLRLTGAYITAPVRCAPPQNRPLPAERERCAQFLVRELALLRYAVVYLALGRFGYDALTAALEVRQKPPFGHGAEVTVDGRHTIVCSYHVSQQNTFTGRLTAAMFDEVLVRARTLSDATTKAGGPEDR